MHTTQGTCHWPPFLSLNKGVPPSTLPPSGTSNSSMTPAAGEGTCTDVCGMEHKSAFTDVRCLVSSLTTHSDRNICLNETYPLTLSVSISQTTSSSETVSPTAGNRWNPVNMIETHQMCSSRTNPDDVLPFSHLTSPSVTDSANAGVFTVITSFPEIQSQHISHCILIDSTNIIRSGDFLW